MAKEKYSYGYAQEKYKPLKQKEEKYNLYNYNIFYLIRQYLEIIRVNIQSCSTNPIFVFPLFRLSF